jgi:hypothetical protein
MVLFENSPSLLLLFVAQITIVVLNILILVKYTNIHHKSGSRKTTMTAGIRKGKTAAKRKIRRKK